MKTLCDVASLVWERGANRDRVLSEYGLARAEIEAVVADRLTFDSEVEILRFDVANFRELVEDIVADGVVLGIAWERERRK